jgi:acetyl esterase/lipase
MAVAANAQERVRDVIYMKQSGCAYTMDVFKPKTPNHKAVMWIESFGWFSDHEFSEDIAKAFTNKGFTFFDVIHGSQPKYTIAEIIPMVTRAVRYIRANASAYSVDADAIGVGGANSGGHLALEIGGLADVGMPAAPDPVDKVSGRANAIVALFPPTDLLNWGSKGNSLLEDPASKQMAAALGTVAHPSRGDVIEFCHDLSPIYLVKTGYPPTLLLHGDADKYVPLQQSQEMDSALEAARVVHKLIVVHGMSESDDIYNISIPVIVDWFEKHLSVAHGQRSR